MIRINLLPTRELKQQAAARQQLYLAGAILLVALIGIAVLWREDLQTLARLEGEKETLKAELDRLKKIVEEVNAFERRQKLLQARVETIQRLRRNQTGPVRVLDQLSQGLPDEVWLEGVDEKSGVYQAIGYALTNFAVADLMKNLQQSKEFAAVDLVSSEMTLLEGRGIKKFIIRFQRTGETGEVAAFPLLGKGRPGA
jgi:type IV pilus assembly protein PilN